MDDLIAVVVIAPFFAATLGTGRLLLALLGLVLCALRNRLGVRSVGSVCWSALQCGCAR